MANRFTSSRKSIAAAFSFSALMLRKWNPYNRLRKSRKKFEHICEKKEFEIPSHFAILPEPNGTGETKTQKESRLLNLNIRPIWFPDGAFHLVDGYLRLLIDASSKRIRV